MKSICRCLRIGFVLLLVALATPACQSFRPQVFVHRRNPNRRYRLPSQKTATSIDNTNSVHATATRPCVYKNYDNRWKQRRELDSLTIGQELECTILDSSNMIVGKTGNKIFCECGVGRCRDGETWKLVFGMLRLDRKESAARKKLQRLKSKPCFTAYVSRLRPDNDEFEIALTADNLVEKKQTISMSSLRVGQEVVGQVERVEPYGVLVSVHTDDDSGAIVNRHGLLHIQRVADLFGHFINKEEGLKEAGLGRGERVRLQVASLESKRLFLDFTDQVKAVARQEREEKERQKELQQAKRNRDGEVATTESASSSSVVDAVVKKALPTSEAVADFDEELVEEDDEDWDDEYDEDKDIEDQLGLGTY